MTSEIPIYQIDAFASRVFAGNPAAVCPLTEWLADEVLQGIAAENNLAETAFLMARDDGDYDLRWFTPAVEVDLCGHATLASAYVIDKELEPGRAHVRFHSMSGPLEVARYRTLLKRLPRRSAANRWKSTRRPSFWPCFRTSRRFWRPSPTSRR
jgi:predicted PhzF superfamily epimerase YddE/YHI9